MAVRGASPFPLGASFLATGLPTITGGARRTSPPYPPARLFTLVSTMSSPDIEPGGRLWTAGPALAQPPAATGIAAGTALIQASYQGVTGSATMNVSGA